MLLTIAFVKKDLCICHYEEVEMSWRQYHSHSERARK